MYDIAIIGAGVTGASIAYQLARYDLNILLLEAENDVSDGTTKANSAIIHAGFDPKPGTKMAYHNVRGVKLAKEVCQKLDVPYKQCGALVVGFSNEDHATLKELERRGIANGVEGLDVISGDQAREMEPQLSREITCALWAPTSAIVSPWELCLALAETAVKNGVDLKLNSAVTAIRKEDELFVLTAGEKEYRARYIVNAAGVKADKVHELIGEKEFTIYPGRGQYFLLDKSEGKRTSRTIFQCPTELGKGVLVSPTVHGNLIVGPNSEKNKDDDTSTTSEGLNYVRNLARYSIPSIDFRENIRNFAGIRARCDRDDFIIEESRSVPGFFNLAGIQSPGLSSALSFGEEIENWLKGKGVELKEKADFIDTRKKIRFKELSDAEKNELIKKDPAYGRVICRCETVTEGEILEALKGVIPPVSIDGVKRRCGSGMGRCQGGFCGERIADILMREKQMSGLDVLQDKEGSNILLEQVKGK